MAHRTSFVLYDPQLIGREAKSEKGSAYPGHMLNGSSLAEFAPVPSPLIEGSSTTPLPISSPV